jgi:hypothetical protein
MGSSHTGPAADRSFGLVWEQMNGPPTEVSR